METREYKCSFGIVKISIDGDHCTGSYQKNGEFTGSIKNNIIKAEWSNEGQNGLLELDLTDQKLIGRWKQGIVDGPMRGKWSGALVESSDNDISSQEKEGNFGPLIEIEYGDTSFDPAPFEGEDGDWSYEKVKNHLKYFVNELSAGEKIILPESFYVKIDEQLVSFPSEFTEELFSKYVEDVWFISFFVQVYSEFESEIDNILLQFSQLYECNFYAHYRKEGILIRQCYDNGEYDSGYFLDDNPDEQRHYIFSENEDDIESKYYHAVTKKLNL